MIPPSVSEIIPPNNNLSKARALSPIPLPANNEAPSPPAPNAPALKIPKVPVLFPNDILFL